MFDRSPYVPVLRWKKAEREALETLDVRARDIITPLIELPLGELLGLRRKHQMAPSQYLTVMADDVIRCWGQARLFVDFRLADDALDIDGKHPLSVLAQLLLERGGVLVPVTGVERSTRYQRAVRTLARSGNGVCIRLCVRDLGPGAKGEVDRLLSSLQLDPGQADLIVDWEFVGADVRPDARAFCGIPHIADWRSLTSIAGAFPKDLTKFRPGIHTLERTDLLTWRTWLTAADLPRSPAYGDYATQHGVFVEPPPRANLSASIRYACDEYWLIMRGEGVLNPDGEGYDQWPANARLLCERHEFQGPMYSAGDNFIYLKTHSSGEPGNATQWVFAGLSHHLTLTARQMAGFQTPPEAGAKQARAART